MRKENFNVLLIGMIGTGKTQMGLRFLARSPRALVLDRQSEYEGGAIFTDFRSATSFFLEHRRDNWQIVYQDMNPDAHLAWIDLLFECQMNEELPPVALFLDESSYYSTSHNVGAILDKLYTKGRHARISTFTTVQRMTQINPIIRDQSHVWISLRLKSFPSDMKERFSRADLERIPFLEDITPDVTPTYGQHYLTDVGDYEFFEKWSRVLQGDGK